jgi:hypothetical protein
MKRTWKSLAYLAVLLAAIACFQPQAYADVTLTLAPADGAIGGDAGQTVGWGFTLTNDTAYYLSVSGSAFLTGGSIGVFNDLLGPQGLLLAPDQSITEAFDAFSATGLGSLVLDAASPTTAYGQIMVSYDLLYSPTDFDSGIFGQSVFADASATVPEPLTILLLAPGLMGLAGMRRKFAY